MCKDKPETISLYEFFQQFPNEEAARLYFEKKRWNNKPQCTHCGSENIVECKNHKPMPYRCKDCRKHFSVRQGTILEESRLPLQKWLMAIYMMTTARKGIPSTQMARELGVTQKTAWFLAQRIREAWMNNQTTKDTDDNDMGGHTQVDEAYFGGKESNKHASKKKKLGRGAVGKTPVLGIRGEDGQVKAKTIQNTKKETLQGFINENVKGGSTVVTDDFKSYNDLSKKYNHIAVKHSVGEYIKDQAHTNGIESFWALLKRGYYGIFHHITPKHLNRYVCEFSFRHNTARTNTIDFINMTINRMESKRITYKELINA
jgi:transposase-like protein